MNVSGARDYIIQRLRTELNPSLYYHSVEHTLDVYEAVRRLITAENTGPDDSALLETAALFHDSGLLVQYSDHEIASSKIADSILPGFGYSPEEIDCIAGLIMVTRLPQRPVTPVEKILCDADLDYLGREDFFIHSFQLRLEWQLNGIRNLSLQDWFKTQVSFLSAHQYFTISALSSRNEQKRKNLEEVKILLNHVSQIQ